MEKIRSIIKELIDLVKTKGFGKHFLIAFCAMGICFFLLLKLVGRYTEHNQLITVPDFAGLEIQKLDSITRSLNLRYMVIDSIFNAKLSRGHVIEQDPIAGTKVKENRMVYLTINALQNKMIQFPEIHDMSLRQAKRILENLGLVVGNLEYKKDIGKDIVLNQKINGIKISAGKKVFVGTKVDLVLGTGIQASGTTFVPNLIGLTLEQAKTEINLASLELGAVILDDGIVDSTSTVVYKQIPEEDNLQEVSVGSLVDIFLR